MRKSHYRIASDKETPRGKLCALLREFSHELKRAYTKSSAKRCLKRGIYVAAAVAELAKQAKEEFRLLWSEMIVTLCGGLGILKPH